ncbi:MAG TPA: LytTR family DNA-binding domain-containing protein [Chryseolinea sp.]
MINAILIDDEAHCLDSLSILLNKLCPDVQIVQRCLSAKQGLEAVLKYKIDLVFLDVEMPSMNGFQFLEQFSEIPFSVIFTTAYDKYAIRAIRFSALDYLLKPIDSKELVAAVHKVGVHNHQPTSEQFRMLLDKIQNKENALTKIAVPIAEGFELVKTDDIITCEADNNYTYLHLKNKRKITACRTLKEVEEQLESFSSFIRVHNSYIVNLNEVTKYIRGDGGYLTMSDGSMVDVSRSRKTALLKFF